MHLSVNASKDSKTMEEHLSQMQELSNHLSNLPTFQLLCMQPSKFMMGVPIPKGFQDNLSLIPNTEIYINKLCNLLSNMKKVDACVIYMNK